MKKEIHLRNGKGYDQYIDLLKETTEWFAKQHSISPDSMRFTCGATGALDAVLSLLDQGSVIATMPFEYFDIRRLAEARGLRIAPQQHAHNVYLNSIETFTQWLRKTKPPACYISLPNNPNGQEYSKEQLKNVFAAMKGRVVILDQSLLADQVIPFKWLNAHRAGSRLYVVRSFSKSHGLVGERIGMLFFSDGANVIHKYAHAPSASSLQRLRKKWTSTYVDSCLQMIHRNSKRMTDWGNLHTNLFVAPSKTNCTCIHFHDIRAQDVAGYLKNLGVFVNSNIDLGTEGNFIRVDITVPTASIRTVLSCIDAYIAKHKM